MDPKGAILKMEGTMHFVFPREAATPRKKWQWIMEETSNFGTRSSSPSIWDEENVPCLPAFRDSSALSAYKMIYQNSRSRLCNDTFESMKHGSDGNTNITLCVYRVNPGVAPP